MCRQQLEGRMYDQQPADAMTKAEPAETINTILQSYGSTTARTSASTRLVASSRRSVRPGRVLRHDPGLAKSRNRLGSRIR
eukprot:2125363-Rhodomonas_salina.1